MKILLTWRPNATRGLIVARLSYCLRLAVAFTLIGAAAPTLAQETFRYRVYKATTGWSPMATSDTFYGAFTGIHTLMAPSNARFLADSTETYGGIHYTYISTPYVYAFWNKTSLNGMIPGGPNSPSWTSQGAIDSAIALSRQNMESYPAANPLIADIHYTSEFTRLPSSVGTTQDYVYSAKVDLAYFPGMGGTGDPRTVQDEIRGAVAYAEIFRTIAPACSCEKKDPTMSEGKLVGNPIDTASGAKVAFETDYRDVTGLLNFSRSYNSQVPTSMNGMGNKGSWQHSFERTLTSDNTFIYTADAVRSDFAVHAFNAGSGASWIAARSNPLRLFREQNNAIGSTFRLFVPHDNSNELYDAKGLLLAIRRADDEVFLTYSTLGSDTVYPANAPACAATAVRSKPNKPGQLLCVTNRFGRQLNFAYDDSGSLRTMFDPAGMQYSYEFSDGRNLTQVTYPDGFRRVYHYGELENTSNMVMADALTGISVERSAGVLTRFATYKYNSKGLAISTEHAGAVNKFTVSYDLPAMRRSVVAPTGSSRQLQLAQNNYAFVLTGDALSVAGSPTATTSSDFDENGNPQKFTDRNGAITQYTYDLTRDVETQRVMGVGTPDVRTISTEWHPTYRLPLRVAQPKRLVTNTYDPAGNLLTSRVQATSDLTGAQGFAASLVGAARLNTYEYNAANQIVKVTGPRTDIVEITTYQYDGQGNLTSVTNPLGHQTLLSNYDAYGRAGRISDPNGVVTDFLYTPRGDLASSVSGGESTSYSYYGTGQLAQASRSGGATITYSYDDASRLTGISDNLGNTITYTLDTSGNRIGEATRDPNGLLSRQIDRVFDAYNRLKQVTGAPQ